MDCLGNKGRAVFVGVNPKAEKAIAPQQFIHREIALFGSKVLPLSLVPEMMRFMASHDLHFDPVVSQRIGLEEAPEALARFNAGGAGKFVIEM